MSAPEVLIRERAEEIRSRLAVLDCTLEDLKRDFYNVFDKFYSRGISPPLLFPVSTFVRFNGIISDIKREVEDFDPEHEISTIAHKLNEWNARTETLLSEISRLQNVLSQRTSGLGKPKIFEYQQGCEVEYASLSKAYIAADIFTFELVKRTLGKKWIKDEKYIPISLFDDRGYMINLYSYVISIPFYDNFRSRFWPVLAHEVAHILVDKQAREYGPLQRVMLDGQDWMIETLGLDPYNAALQIAELSCDIIATYVCPTALISALENNSLYIPLESTAGLSNVIRFQASHPPTDSRLSAMEEVLEREGMIACDPILEDICRTGQIFFSMKNLTISSISFDFIEQYNDFARMYAGRALHVLPLLEIQSFCCPDWQNARQSFDDPDMDPQSPIHLLALVWLKRLHAASKDGQTGARHFFSNRTNETKTFEYVVDQIYKYYEKEIIPKLKVKPYDVRVSLG